MRKFAVYSESNPPSFPTAHLWNRVSLKPTLNFHFNGIWWTWYIKLWKPPTWTQLQGVESSFYIYRNTPRTHILVSSVPQPMGISNRETLLLWRAFTRNTNFVNICFRVEVRRFLLLCSQIIILLLFKKFSSEFSLLISHSFYKYWHFRFLLQRVKRMVKKKRFVNYVSVWR